jgi:two-component system, LytTR family, sensor kinase
VVDHLESELKDAEINLLKNELDPHFVYNSLMPLYYLVKNDKSTAEQFACKLIQVYQYFLQNRNKDFISLQEEMEFLDNYLFLLRIRYKDSIDISYTGLENIQMQMILPFSLQLLIENAIKHNCFDQEHPLKIRIGSEKNYPTISNHVNFKKDIIYSSGIGLKNLRARYRILCSKNIIVTEQKNHFIVKLPLNQTVKMNDNYNYYRRRSN